MAAKKTFETNYFDLTKHNSVQLIVLFFLLTSGLLLTLSMFFPMMKWVFTEYLQGEIYNSGQILPYSLEPGAKLKATDYYFSWCVDVYKGTAQETRYWFNPILALITFSITLAIGFGFLVSAILPHSLGLIRQKIDRELASALDNICLKTYGYHSDEERINISNDLQKADLRDLHDFERLWGMNLEDLKVLQKALIWRQQNFIMRILNVNKGLQVYLRFYFTVKYSNTLLGMVYMGAAVLIIIIGLRGLKFIPATDPSLVFFALGLEFSLLMVYAFVLMYGREESDTEAYINFNSDSNKLDKEFGNAKEVEHLLRTFISKPNNNNNEGN